MPLATEMTEKGGVSVSSLGQRQTEEPETGMLENEGISSQVCTTNKEKQPKLKSIG